MTQDFVAEKIGHSNFGQVTELDCPQCGIQSVDLGDGQLFQRLRRLVFVYILVFISRAHVTPPSL